MEFCDYRPQLIDEDLIFNFTPVGGTVTSSTGTLPYLCLFEGLSIGWIFSFDCLTTPIGDTYTYKTTPRKSGFVEYDETSNPIPMQSFSIEGLRLNPNVTNDNGVTTFNNYRFKMTLGQNSGYNYTTAQNIVIPEEVQNLEGYGIGKNNWLTNYINFPSLTFVRRCKLSEDGSEVEAIAPTAVDISPYMSSRDLDLTDRDTIIFENENNEPVRSSIFYQVKL